MIDELELKKIIKTSLNLNTKPKNLIENKEEKSIISEVYVAQPKLYQQVSEYISQRTKDAHTNLYKGDINSLNEISAKIDAYQGDINSNHSTYRSLKIDESANLNSVWLHEQYFSNCFDPHSEIYMDSTPYMKLENQWGTFERWQDDFVKCCLSTRNGWAICGYNLFLKQFINTFIDEDSQNVMLGIIPLIVIDMHEHSHYRDFLTNKEDFVVVSMRELNWEIIEERFKRVERIIEGSK